MINAILCAVLICLGWNLMLISSFTNIHPSILTLTQSHTQSRQTIQTRLNKQFIRNALHPHRHFAVPSAIQFDGISVTSRNVDEAKKIYEDVCGFECSDYVENKKFTIHLLSGQQNSRVIVEFKASDQKKHEPIDRDQINRAFHGIGFRLSRPRDIFHTRKKALLSSGGIVRLPMNNYSYGASLFPSEEDNYRMHCRYGRIEDADGYSIEIAHHTSSNSTRAKISIHVLDMDESIDYYTKYLKMKLLRRRFDVISDPPIPRGVAYLGFGNEKDDLILELVYNYSVETMDHAFPIELRFSTPDLNQLTGSSGDKKSWDLPSDNIRNNLLLKDPSGHQIIVAASDPNE